MNESVRVRSIKSAIQILQTVIELAPVDFYIADASPPNEKSGEAWVDVYTYEDSGREREELLYCIEFLQGLYTNKYPSGLDFEVRFFSPAGLEYMMADGSEYGLQE